MQLGHQTSEDCLTLNVWTKPQTGEKAKAVLVWIFGGGFATGNSANPIYNGEFIADNEDVVVVSFKYVCNPCKYEHLVLIYLATDWAFSASQASLASTD